MSRRLRVKEFEYFLPSHRIAQRPRPPSEQKLLVCERRGRGVSHRFFQELPDLLRKGDVLVVNNTRVVPAQLRWPNGEFVLIMEPTAESFTNVRAICPSRPSEGDKIRLSGCTFLVKSVEPGWDVRVGDLVPDEPFKSLPDFLEVYGSHPIPTYVKRDPDQQDLEDFQTIFAASPGSIAAPTAGLHFDQDLVARVHLAGVELCEVTLHVGYGTFRSFKGEFVDEHSPDAEWYRVGLKAVEVLRCAKSEGRRIVAVGTTTVRVLETIWESILKKWDGGDLEGRTELFVFPPYEFRVVDALITNLHYPRTPVMSLTAAFVGSVGELVRLYEAAKESDYLFYSYGDAMLIL